MGDTSNILEIIRAVEADVQMIRRQYGLAGDLQRLQEQVEQFAETYRLFPSVGDRLIALGEEWICDGSEEAGIAVLQIVEGRLLFLNTTTLYIRLAEHFTRSGDTETGIRYLQKLLTEGVSNLEESAEHHGLEDVLQWLKETLKQNAPQLKCSPVSSVSDVFALPKEHIISALSEHIQKRVSNGDPLRTLNPWECVFFYADELCMEVNSDGFSGYLYYYGIHFKEACQAMSEIGARQTLALLKAVEAKFPKKQIPHSLEKIQEALDIMEDGEIDFEAEDELYYETVEKELLAKLLEYVTVHQQHFCLPES